MRRLTFALVAACAAPSPSVAPRVEPAIVRGAIEGVVIDATTSAPLPNISVAIDRDAVYTDAGGAWTLTNLLPGPYTLDILALDGLTQLDVMIDPGRTTRFDVRLDPARIRALERAATPVQTTKAACTPSAIETRLGARSGELVDCGVISSITTEAVHANARECIARAIASHRPFRFADDSYGFGLVSLRRDGELRSYEIHVFDGSDIGDRTIHGTIRQCHPLVMRPHPPEGCKDFESACNTCEALIEVPGCVVPVARAVGSPPPPPAPGTPVP